MFISNWSNHELRCILSIEVRRYRGNMEVHLNMENNSFSSCKDDPSCFTYKLRMCSMNNLSVWMWGMAFCAILIYVTLAMNFLRL
jgi:hypothetical protein